MNHAASMGGSGGASARNGGRACGRVRSGVGERCRAVARAGRTPVRSAAPLLFAACSQGGSERAANLQPVATRRPRSWAHHDAAPLALPAAQPRAGAPPPLPTGSTAPRPHGHCGPPRSRPQTQVTCGSSIKLAHAASGYRLHSHGVGYSHGSKQQSVTAFPDGDSAGGFWVLHGAAVGAARPTRAQGARAPACPGRACRAVVARRAVEVQGRRACSRTGRAPAQCRAFRAAPAPHPPPHARPPACPTPAPPAPGRPLPARQPRR